jgi:hypothetical protein
MAFSQEVSGLLLHLFPIFAHPPKKKMIHNMPELQFQRFKIEV